MTIQSERYQVSDPKHLRPPLRGTRPSLTGMAQVVAAALAISCLGSVAHAQVWGDSMVVSHPAVVHGNRIVFEPDAYIELRRSVDPMAAAEIVFENRLVNGPHHNGTYHLALDDVEVDLIFTWDYEGKEDDRIEVITGASFWTLEPSLDVEEETEAVILIYPAIS